VIEDVSRPDASAEASVDALPPVRPAPRAPCARGMCWLMPPDVAACGPTTIAENFRSGRYNVHRYRVALPAGSAVRIELQITAGAALPALVVATSTGRVLSDGEVPDLSGNPEVVVERSGRGGGSAVVRLRTTDALEIDVFVTSWEVVDAGFERPIPTTTDYALSVRVDCPPPVPGAGLAPRGTVADEVDAVAMQDVALDATFGRAFRVDAAGGEHVTFRLEFAPSTADIRWEVLRFDGTVAQVHVRNDGDDLREMDGLRAVAVLDRGGSRTYWFRARREGGASLRGTLRVERAPFIDAVQCTVDCSRFMLLPQADTSLDGYGVPGHTIYPWQFGRRDLIMALRHAGRRTAANAGGPYTVKDLSRHDGRVWYAHSTHDNGFHADLSLLNAAGDPVWGALCTPVTTASGDVCARGSVRNFGAEPMARLIDALFDSGRITWVLLDAEYHAPLLEAVDRLIALGVIAPARRPLFDATTPACSGRPCVRHVVSHYHHVHVAVVP